MRGEATTLDHEAAPSGAAVPTAAWRRNSRRSWGWPALALVVVLLLPLVVRGTYSRNLLVLAGIYGIAAIGLNVVMGMMGQFSFGHAAFWGIGAYVSGRLSLHAGVDPWLGLVIAGAAAGVVGLLLGAVALRRTRGLELAIVTLGFGAIAWILALRWDWFGGGQSGISGVPSLALLGVDLSSPFRFYYVTVVLTGLVLWAMYRIRRSRLGRAVISIRENEPLAASVGVAPVRYYVMAFGLGSAIGGLSGALYAHYQQFLNPSLLNLPVMIMFLMMVLLGGTRVDWGPVLGAGLYMWVTELLRFNEELTLLLFGAAVVVIVRFIPEGVSSLLIDTSRRLSARWRPPPPAREGSLIDDNPNASAGQDPPPVETARPSTPLVPPARTAPAGTPLAPPLLATRSLCKSFGGLRAVADLDLTVHAGEILGLIGPNGCGKTTTINVLSGFLPATSGTTDFLGHDITQLPPHEIAARGLVRTFQLSNVFASLSVADNVLHASHRSFSQNGTNASPVSGLGLDELIEFVGLADRRVDSAAELSAGERRYLEIANALAARPKVLLLDEPACGLNPEEATRLVDLVRALRETGMTVMIVEHNMKVIMRLCDRIVVLDRGAPIAEGTPQEIRDNNAVVAAYLGRSGRDQS